MIDYNKYLNAVDRNKRSFGVEDVKKEQVESLYNFINGKDVFVNLPTGFGKSFIYQMSPFVIEQLGIRSCPIIVVASPLVALMQEQVNFLNSLEISSVCLSKADKHDPKLMSGNYTFVYTSPESLLADGSRRKLFSSTKREFLALLLTNPIV